MSASEDRGRQETLGDFVEAAMTTESADAAGPGANPAWAPGWYDDPYGRHQLRYFDGAIWLPDVEDGGVVSSDPMHVPPPPHHVDPSPGGGHPTPTGLGTYTRSQLGLNSMTESLTPDSPVGAALAQFPPPAVDAWCADPLNPGWARYVERDGRWSGTTRLIVAISGTAPAAPKQPAPTQPSGSKRRIWPWVAGGAAGAVALVTAGIVALIAGTAVTNSVVAPATTAVDFSIVVMDTSSYSSGNCTDGISGYNDVSAGSSVLLSSDTGKTLGTGTLSVSNSYGSSGCLYTATITGVPKDESFYHLKLGHRSDLVYSQSDLSAANWKMETTLGH